MLPVCLLAIVLVASTPAHAAEPLRAYAADAANVTVSGVSSGGYMAVQFQVAHSSVVKGVGVLAAGPYYCAQGSVWTAYYNCTAPSAWAPLPSVGTLKADAEALAFAKQIDPTADLSSARVWLFSGTNDHTVEVAVVDALRSFYALYGVPSANLVFVRDLPAGHAMVTKSAGAPCQVTRSPFINDCDYDAAGELLRHLLGPLEPPAAQESGRLVAFDQKAFAGGDAYGLSMADTGYLYVPQRCQTERCRVHIAFHGCQQSVEAIGEQFMREAGYNRWADTNHLIVLYPQTINRSGWGFRGGRSTFVYNPRGCWDWWGYTGPQYHTKAGAQIRAVKEMVDRVGETRR